MKSTTVEFQRFGDPTGVIRLSDRYIRTIGTVAPTEEVSFTVAQEILDAGMATLDYASLRGSEHSIDLARRRARHFIQDVVPLLRLFLFGTKRPAAREKRHQIDIVTQALELAQLPFEALEEEDPNLVITRRIRQPWPAPEVVYRTEPKVLFVWAEPRKRAGSTTRMTVPHDEHRRQLDEVLGLWGGADGPAVTEVPHATRSKLRKVLAQNHGFTHVHFLAHGVPSLDPGASKRTRVNLKAKPPAPTCFALEKGREGTIDRCPPETLAKLFKVGPLPETFTAATCFSGKVDPVRSGGTLAHHLHEGGIPIVLASQLALTKKGSVELIRNFLEPIIWGADPREAVRGCRDALRSTKDETYYDRVALVSYIHLDGDYRNRLTERRFNVSLEELKAISREAEQIVEGRVEALRTAGAPPPKPTGDAKKIQARFRRVRSRLEALEDELELNKEQREELWGLKASSFKREAEAAWRFSGTLTGQAADDWSNHSRAALDDALEAYRVAASHSRDHHWSWVQFLVLEAVRNGTLDGHEDDWICAGTAALDDLSRHSFSVSSEQHEAKPMTNTAWALGSLVELYLLAPLTGRPKALADATTCLDRIGECCELLLDVEDRDDALFPITSTQTQLERYETWWGRDPALKLPQDILNGARELHQHLDRLHDELRQR
jgi:hypothetical protein